MRTAARVWVGGAVTCLGLATGAAIAQVNLPFKLPTLPGTSPKAPERTVPDSASDKGLLPVKPNAKVADELKPDKLCQRVEENTDVWGKLADYGGVEAQLRMQRLLASDFKHGDLTQQDRDMLRYIAYTTIWVPPSIESNLGRLYSAFASDSSGAESATNRREQASLKRVDEQLQAFRSMIPDFPGTVQLTLDKSPTGASARPGGIIALSRDFLNRMDENVKVQRLVLAHELSHLYKRHAIKELQYQLITNSGGFEIGRKLLGRFNPNSNRGILDIGRDAYTLTTAASELFDFVRVNQLSFQSNQELEADACSVEWMKRVNQDPMELWEAFADIQAVTPSEQNSYFRTHPTNEERRANIERVTQPKKQERVAPKATPGKR